MLNPITKLNDSFLLLEEYRPGEEAASSIVAALAFYYEVMRVEALACGVEVVAELLRRRPAAER